MKKTTKMKLFRGISLMLCIIMMMQLTQLFVFAVGEDMPAAETNGEATPIENPPSENLFELGEGELPYAQLQELSPLDVALPETITRAQAIEKGHVNRLYAQEKTLQSVLYQNQNGTKTAYVFDKPVKYVRDGEVLDKDTTIRATGIAGYAYAMTENSFSAYFGSTAANGVMIQYEDYAFSMKPETSMLVSTPTLGEDAKTVVYNGAFGAQTALRYETQLSGVKEDIILMRNVGKYAFNFLLTTSGLTPVQKENGAWTLVNADQETVIDFGSIVIKDSAGKTVYGTLNITPRAAGGYIMTVTVPQAFLKSANTVYPVYVDPTTVIQETKSTYYYVEDEETGYIDTVPITYQAIWDTSLYWKDATFGGDLNEHVLCGDSCAVFYLNDFIDPRYGLFVDLEQYMIGKTTLYVRPISCIDSTISAYPMLCEPYWDSSVEYLYEDEAIFNWTTNNSSTQQVRACGDDNCAISTCSNVAEPIGIDITNIARGWARYNTGESTLNYENPAYGFALFNEEMSDRDRILSVDASGNSNVYYEMDYSYFGGICYIKNIETSLLLRKIDLYKMDIGALCETGINDFRFVFDYQGNNQFLIRSYSNNRMLCVEENSNLNRKEVSLLPLDTVLSNITKDNFIWNVLAPSNIGIVIKSKKNGMVLCYEKDAEKETYDVFSVSSMTSDDPNYKKAAWAIMNECDFVEPTSITITQKIDYLNINETFSADFVAAPANLSWKNDWEWISADPSIAEIYGNGNIKALKNGYTRIAIRHIPTGKYETFPLVVGQMIPNGIYQIRNIYSGKYIDLENASQSDGANIQQWDHHTQIQSKWIFNYTNNGYYTIQSCASLKYVSVSNGSLSNGAGIIQTSTVSEASKWKISVSDSGGYIFTAKCSEAYERVLSLPNNSLINGTDLQQITYSNDSNYRDEWYLYYDAILHAHRDKKDAIKQLYKEGTYNVLYGVSNCSNMMSLFSKFFKKQEIKNFMENTKFLIIQSHGSKIGFQVTDYESYKIDDIVATDMGRVRLVIFLNCLCAAGGYQETDVLSEEPNNVVEAAIVAGATTSLGFTKEVYGVYVDNWWINVINYMYTNDATLSEAIEYNNDIHNIYDPDVVNTRHDLSDIAVVGGNASITLTQIFQ